MIPREDNAFEVSSNFQGRSKNLSVDLANVPHLMNILTKQYSDPAMAVIREYSTNALDSHIEANNNSPIEIKLPTALNSTFVVQDYGIGMSEDDLMEIYTSYGASTKRTTDEVTGMMGLGCKSALAYTEQFSIETVKDGIVCNAIISRDAKGSGKIDIVNSSKTNKSNGVKITLAVKDSTDFNRKAEFFFSFWKEEDVIINKQRRKSLTELFPGTTFEQISDNTTLVKNIGKDWRQTRIHSDIIVMGNVPYTLSSRSLSGRLGYETTIITEVPIGTVDPVPSREALEFNPRTKKVIEELQSSIFSELLEYIRRKVELAENHTEAFLKAAKWNVYYRLSQNISSSTYLYYKGDKVPLDDTKADCTIAIYTPYTEQTIDVQRARAKLIEHKWFASGNYNYILIKNYMKINEDEGKEHTIKVLKNTRDRAKLRKWAEINNRKVSKFILFASETLPLSPWTDGIEAFDWEDINKTRLEEPKKQDTKSTDKKSNIRAFTIDPKDPSIQTRKGLDSSQIPAEQNKILLSPTSKVLINTLLFSFPEDAIVVLAKNRWKKFLRENENSFTALATIQTEIHNNVKDIEDFTLLKAMGWPPFSLPPRIYLDINPRNIDDPKFRKYIRVMHEAEKHFIAHPVRQQKQLTRLKELSQIERTLLIEDGIRTGPRENLKSFLRTKKSLNELIEYIKESYPLLNYNNSRSKKDIYEYVNALYAYRQNTKEVKES